MILEHRNSQKRIYIAGAFYFITCVTHERFPYFREEIFCQLFVENLRICKKLKGFKLYGWFLGYDHFHWQIEPGDQWNYSQIMKSLKENVSCAINRVMIPPPIEGATTSSRLQLESWRQIYADKYDILKYQNQFHQKYRNGDPFPKFHWQKSFHDHYLRNTPDFMTHLEYIAWNPIKHGLPAGWPYVFTNRAYGDLLDPF